MFVLPLILILALSISTSTYAGVIECDPRFLPTYPVTGSYPIYDYDANCWAEYSTWVPRNWGRFPSPPIRPAPPEVVLTINGPNGISWYITPVRDAARDVSVFQFSGKRLTFPIDIRPSVRPIATIELFLKVDDFVPGRFAFLFSTESYGATNRTQPGRALMATDVLNNNCSNHFHPLGPDSSTQCTLVSNSLTGFVQLVITFDQPNQRATIWLNSMFSQTFNLSTFDDLSTLTINGRAGGSSFDMPSNISLAYLRMWDRYLAPAEMRAVSEPWFRAYNRPVFTTFFPAYVLSNATSMNWTASAIGGLMTWETRQYPLLRDTSQLLGNGYGGNASVVATVNHTYSVTARVCPFPSLQYTLAPFFASTELCDLEVTTIYGTMLPYAEPLRVTSFRSIPSDPAEQYICAGSVQRASYYISFSKSVRQAATMPLMEPIRPGQGYGFVDNFDGYFATGRDLQFTNDTFTRLTEDRRSFRWDVNVRCSWEGTHGETVRARIPDASIWNITDDQGNPLAVDQSATPGDTRWWEHPLQTFAMGLNAVISYSTRNCSSAGPRLTFQVNFNFPVSGFNPTQDVILCNNCTLVSVTQTGGVPFYSYQILAPSLAPNQRFIVSLAINPLSSIYDAAFPWSNLARAVGLFPPMYKAVGVEGPSCNIFDADSPPISTSSSSSAAPSYSSSASTASSRPSSGLPTTSSLQPSAVPSLSSSSAVPSNRSSSGLSTASSAQSSLATSSSFASSSGTNRSSGLQIVSSSAQPSTAEHSVSAATSSSLDLASSASLPPSNQTGTSSSARRCDGQVENCIYEIISNDSGSMRGVLGSMIAGVVGFCYLLMC